MTIATNSEKLMNNVSTQASKRTLRAKKRVDWKERIFHGLFLTSAIIGIVSLAIIAYFIFRESIPAFQEVGISGIVLGQDWLPPALYGVATMIVASVVST
nr:phosphate ABC transporter permease subunit PstC [Vibrio anguillarum]